MARADVSTIMYAYGHEQEVSNQIVDSWANTIQILWLIFTEKVDRNISIPSPLKKLVF